MMFEKEESNQRSLSLSFFFCVFNIIPASSLSISSNFPSFIIRGKKRERVNGTQRILLSFVRYYGRFIKILFICNAI